MTSVFANPKIIFVTILSTNVADKIAKSPIERNLVNRGTPIKVPV